MECIPKIIFLSFMLVILKFLKQLKLKKTPDFFKSFKRKRISINNLVDTISNSKVVVIFFISLILLILLTYKNYGISWDEKGMIDLGNKAYLYYASFGSNKTFLTTEAPYVYATRGMAIEVIHHFFSIIVNNNSIEFYHLFLAIFVIPTFYFVYKTAQLVTGNKSIASISPFFLLLIPRFFGDIFNNSKDIGPGLFVSIIIFVSILIFKNPIKSKKYTFMLLGAAIGIAVSLRVLLIYFLPLFGAYYLLLVAREKPYNIKKYIGNILLLTLSFVGVFYLCSPNLLEKPLTGLVETYNATVNFPWLSSALFEGKYVLSTELPWYYLPKWILITNPIFPLFLLLVSLLSVFNNQRRHNNSNLFRLSITYLALSLFIPIIATVILKPIIYDAWRQFLFLSVPMALMSSLGFCYLVEHLAKWFVLKSTVWMLFFVVLLSTIASYIKLHPYEYIYFNSLVGGLRGAYGHYETDYGGKSMKESAQWLGNHSVNNSMVNVHSCAEPFLASYYFADNMIFVDDLDEADYYICFTRWDAHNRISPDKTIYTVWRDGVPLNYVRSVH